jgi:methylase of polypeptide subunit release factors
VLDLGAGGGVQALLAARHAGQVIAVDANRRSAWFVQANAALNGIHNMTAVTGDWFESGASDRFDLIVCNPPYVIAPDASYLHRDSGWRGDELCWSLVENAAARLTEGGYAHIMCNWIESVDDRWPEVVSRRVGGLPCDVCVIRYGGSDPLSYAAAWNRTLEDHDAYERVLRRWLAYYERLGIREIGQGIVMLRGTRARRPGVLLREGTMLPEFAVTAGDHTKAIFAAIGIGMMSDSDLLESRLVAASGLRIEQQYAARDGRRFAIPAATVSREPGLGLGTRIDPDDVPLVLSLRPDRALADVVSDGEMGSGADAQKLVKIVRTFRELIALGMVLVPEMSSESR